MMLRELLGEGPDVAVTGLAFDNRAVEPGTLFFCVPGFTRDGHDFAPDAIARGAVALVVQRPLGLGVPEVVVPDVRAAWSASWRARRRRRSTSRLRSGRCSTPATSRARWRSPRTRWSCAAPTGS